MPETLERRSSTLNLNLCFTKIKFRPTISQSTKPQTPEDHKDLNQTKDSISTTTVTRNFNTLYEEEEEEEDEAADLARAFASGRFFIAAPGLSKSIVDVAAGVAVVAKMSPDPYGEFRRSMEEMVEARETRPSRESLDELLLCYLALNAKTTHNSIIAAFSDLLITL